MIRTPEWVEATTSSMPSDVDRKNLETAMKTIERLVYEVNLLARHITGSEDFNVSDADAATILADR